MTPSVLAVSATLCSIGATFVGPGPDVGVVLAVSTGTPVRAEVPTSTPYASLADTILSVVGYRFEVLASAGGPVALEKGETFVAVPWEYDASCRPLPWNDFHWVPRGVEAVFYVRETRRADTGERAIDVLGWHEPYPFGRHIRLEGHPRPSGDVGAWLDARAYFELLSALPDAAAFESPSAYREALRQVFLEGDPRWSTRFPGTEVLRRGRLRSEGGP